MRVLVDIPDDIYGVINNHEVFVSTGRGCGKTLLQTFIESIKCGKPVSSGDTNGDMIKALFPDVPVKVFFDMSTVVFGNAQFDLEWWNAKYEGGVG